MGCYHLLREFEEWVWLLEVRATSQLLEGVFKDVYLIFLVQSQC